MRTLGWALSLVETSNKLALGAPVVPTVVARAIRVRAWLPADREDAGGCIASVSDAAG